MSLEISPAAYPLNDKNFFYLAYDHEGETIRKKLPFEEGNKLLIQKTELFKIDGEPIEPMNTTMSLYYMENGTNASLINTFNPVFPDLTELKDEVQIIIDEFSDKPDDVKIQEITAYLGEFYGKPQKDNLAIWLNAEFGLK